MLFASCYSKLLLALIAEKQGLFTQTPYVFLTAEHSVLGQKHDAATLWVENVNSQGFDACLREMQNFDGLHENITVVRFLKLMKHKVNSTLRKSICGVHIKYP